MIARSRYLMRVLAVEVRGLQRAAYVLALFALLSSVLALLRDRVFAHLFGAGITLDLYNAAFGVLDFIFVALTALVSVYVLIPELSKRAPPRQREYIDDIVVGFSILAAAVCAGMLAFAPVILAILFPKFVAAGLLPTLISLTRIMLLQPVLLGFSNIFAAITQSRHRYLLYAISPLLYNGGIIFGAVVLYPMLGISGLAWGVTLGAALHAGIQLPSILQDGFFRSLPRLTDVRSLVATVATSAPRALALSMNQLAYLGLIAMAGLLATGSIAIFRYAYNLQGVPLTVIGASYSVAAFPGLAAALAQGARSRFSEQIEAAARYVVFWSLPATALIIVLRAHVVRVVLGSGAFNWTDTRLTAACLALFSVSLVAQGLTLLIVRAYYASGRTFMPFFVSLGMAAVTVILGAGSIGALHAGFVREAASGVLRVADVPGVSVLALSFAYTISSVAGTLVLLIHFNLRFPGFLRRVSRSWFESLLAALGGGIAAYLVLQLVGPVSLSSTLLSVFLRGVAGGAVGVAAAAALYAVLGNREFEETAALVSNRIPGFMRRALEIEPEVVAAAEEQTAL